MRRRFWAWLCRLSYRRAVARPDEEPDGVPGRRDPEARCSAYAPRERRPGEWGDCQGDGHYLCEECCHKAPEGEEELTRG